MPKTIMMIHTFGPTAARTASSTMIPGSDSRAFAIQLATSSKARP